MSKNDDMLEVVKVRLFFLQYLPQADSAELEEARLNLLFVMLADASDSSNKPAAIRLKGH